MGKIFYLGYYDIPENKKENRNIALAATNKMTYIVSTLDKLGYEVEVVSASATQNSEGYPPKSIKLGKNSKLVLFKTLPSGNKWNRIKSVFYSHFQLLKYLLTVLQKEDKVIVYHSVAYANIVRWAKIIKNFKLVLEVEEIYSDVNGNKRERRKEYKLFRYADAFIFPTELLNKKLNVECKPYSIIYGTYQVEKNRKCKFDDRKIHCIYAGTLDSRKGGAEAAISAATKLNSDYHIHILGFGNEEEKHKIENNIMELSKKYDCKVTYDGLLSGEEYIKFVQCCDIGLSTQDPTAEFNDTSFPSKILSYMANGLRVVSVRIPVIECSAINKYISYYSKQEPEEIAKAIKRVNLSEPYDSRKVILELDLKFQKDIKKLMEKEI